MNIRELVQSTGRVKNRGKNEVFQKKFGSIYLFNKTVQVPKGGGAIVVSMMIGGVTDMIKAGGRRTPVAYHKVSLAINIGDEGKKEYTTEELISAVRLSHRKYADENEFPPQDILKIVLDHPSDFFPDATVFKTSNADGYTLVKNHIPFNSEIQVWCSCSDYYWTFQYYNMQTPCKNNRGFVNLYGNKGYPKTYNYRSERGKNSKNPLRNPGRNPGMCKHLMLLLALLMKEKVVDDGKNGLTKFYNANYKEFIKNNKKQRVSQNEYEQIIKEYKKDHKILNQQRNEVHYSMGNKVSKSYFNPKNGKFSWDNKKKF